jgi:radical SAM protein with 4Fe4S-binding SPASM domain
MSAEERAEPLFFGPTHVDLDLTNACNLACSHCHAASGKPLPDELSTREICKVLDDLYELGVLSVTIAGGEPFLRPDINTILEHVCQLPGQQVVVVTNGTLLNKQMVDRLARSCPSLKVNVSLDGSTSESFAVMRHRKQRGEEADKALFSRVVNNMLRAAKEGLPTGASFVLSRASAADLAATYELAIGDLGVHDFTAIKFFPAGHGQAFLKDLEFSYSEWRTLLLDLTRVKQAGGFPRMALTVPSPWDLYLPLVESGLSTPLIESTWRYTSPLRESTYAGRHEIGDASGIADLNISGNGDVFASVLMGGQKRAFCGNLRTKTLKEIWWTARPLACLRSTSLADIGGPCPSCSIAGLCGAGSRARALHRFDDLRGMDPSCPRVARYLETAVGGQ